MEHATVRARPFEFVRHKTARGAKPFRQIRFGVSDFPVLTALKVEAQQRREIDAFFKQ